MIFYILWYIFWVSFVKKTASNGLNIVPWCECETEWSMCPVMAIKTPSCRKSFDAVVLFRDCITFPNQLTLRGTVSVWISDPGSVSVSICVAQSCYWLIFYVTVESRTLFPAWMHHLAAICFLTDTIHRWEHTRCCFWRHRCTKVRRKKRVNWAKRGAVNI